MPDTPWQALPARARRVYLIGGGIGGVLASLGAGVVPLLISDGSLLWRAAGVLLLVSVCVAAGLRLAHLRWKYTWWKLDEAGLWVRRGRMFFKETLVPRARVQHLDIERGPIERRFGLATLVVHTAGTRLHALRQGGLDEADAVALREALIPQESDDERRA
jgi:hypothetical protein